ncbi:thiamine pyrophosphate-dependent enzyme [uncultured Nostoc sp.]|uniref:thiamine pyrophosphate-dependent enzyme n=1 Tax=uncultured Nostoc sp. TaxID=340711 RepID=UPI0035CB95AB
MRRKQMHSVSETLASMSCALPYAIAAQIAYPDHQCVAFVGDDLIKRYIMSDISEN